MSSTPEKSGSLPRWLLAALLLALTLPFWNLGHAVFEVDDARYAEVPREMVESGDWLSPTLNYVRYIQKPPLIYWLGASSYSLFGVGEAQAHLPVALTGLAGLLLTLWTGSWMLGRRKGALAAVLLASCVQYSLLCRIQTPDMALAVALWGAVCFALRAVDRPEDARWAAPAAWACTALAVLSKGLVGLVFPAGWAFWGFVLVPRARRPLLRLLSPTGIPLFFLIAAPWFLLMQREHPDFFQHFFVEHHFQRFTSDKYGRGGHPLYFVGVLAVGMLPWTPVVLASWRAFWARRSELWREALLLVWAAMIFLFFSASGSKLPTYILPIYPALALVAASRLETLREGPARRWLAGGLAFFVALFLVAPAGILFVPETLKIGMARAELWAWAAAIVASVAGASAAALVLLKRPLAPWAALAAGALGLQLTFAAAFPAFTPYLSAKALALDIASDMTPGREIVTWGTYLHGIPFYTGRRVRVCQWYGELRFGLSDPGQEDWLLDGKLEGWMASGRPMYLVAKAKDARILVDMAGENEPPRFERFGPWVLARYNF